VKLSTAVAILVFVFSLSLTAPGRGEASHVPSARPLSVEQKRKNAIRTVFGKHGTAAIRVARCESMLRPDARNGQFRGVFQMGYAERRRFGHGPGVWAQARAARRYFDYAKGWGPWSCKP